MVAYVKIRVTHCTFYFPSIRAISNMIVFMFMKQLFAMESTRFDFHNCMRQRGNEEFL